MSVVGHRSCSHTSLDEACDIRHVLHINTWVHNSNAVAGKMGPIKHVETVGGAYKPIDDDDFVLPPFLHDVTKEPPRVLHETCT